LDERSASDGANALATRHFTRRRNLAMLHQRVDIEPGMREYVEIVRILFESIKRIFMMNSKVTN
jgi:hypothetical protein